MFQKFFFLFILFFILELFLFIKIGQQIKLTWILTELIGSFILGYSILKRIGFKLSSFQKDNSQKFIKTMLLQVFPILSGIFLIFPGLLTDFIGLILFILQIKPLFSNTSNTSKFKQESTKKNIETTYEILDD